MFLLPVASLLLSFCCASLAQSCSYCGPFDVTADTLPSYVGPKPFPFNSSSGYIPVDPSRNIFYWLVESQSPNPDKDPLIFWYQGGPGCSGLAGLFTEHGPFRALRNGSVVLAQYTWNSYANIVYLEQPCAVGFSYSGVPNYRYSSSDAQAAADNYAFIEGFLQANPKFIGRPTWLAGESYGGVYVPTLTSEILNHPKSDIYAQLSGIMLGNPVLSCDSLNERNVVMNIFYWHTLISQSLYSAWNNAGCPSNSNTIKCGNLFVKAFTQVGKVYQEIGSFTFNGTQPSLDPDDLYQDFIIGNGTLQWVLTLLTSRSETIDEITINYLNRQDVQAALHAHAPPGENGRWDICVRGTLHYNSSGASMIPYYQSLFAQRPDVHVLIYSGDIDIATVPAAQTMECLAELQGSLQKEWGPWFVNGATAGYVEYFKEYTYATVKGAGHTVPQYQPFSSIALFSRYLLSQSLDGGQVYFPPSPTPPVNRPPRQGDMLRYHNIRT